LAGTDAALTPGWAGGPLAQTDTVPRAEHCAGASIASRTPAGAVACALLLASLGRTGEPACPSRSAVHSLIRRGTWSAGPGFSDLPLHPGGKAAQDGKIAGYLPVCFATPMGQIAMITTAPTSITIVIMGMGASRAPKVMITRTDGGV